MNESQCEIIAELSQNVAYNAIVLAKFLLCVVGGVAVLAQWKKLGTRFLVHENSQIFLRFLYATNLCVALCFSTIYLWEFVSGLGFASYFSAHHILVLMSCERLYSSLYPAQFEKHSQRILAVFLALTTIIQCYQIAAK
ncbi:hypothetical protein PFISCL1PPCAC_21393 [Pristionchus fissidentatus]|uniref:G protein-coupled receptor n=1 Tax=Pristionchus fissidentatus TaxID=1538716 RepID=A0AAV5WGS9_9BILA|nr:hypothetical protein PFISCL1PPCAC_21393 [Pristionchus fissidentatus]